MRQVRRQRVGGYGGLGDLQVAGLEVGWDPLVGANRPARLHVREELRQFVCRQEKDEIRVTLR